jgi:hypothetical protein
MNRQISGRKILFKICYRIIVINPLEEMPKLWFLGGAENLMEVSRVISFDSDFATGNEGTPESAKKIAINDTANVVSPLRPRIWKRQMETGNRLLREHIPDRVLDLHPQQSQISEPESKGAVPGFAHPAKKPLDTEKVSIGKSLCGFH